MIKTRIVKIDPEHIDSEGIKQAAEVITKGGIVGFPTETVYGLAADFLNPKAIDKIFRVKKRSREKPLTAQIADISDLERLNCRPSLFAYKLMSRFWPGPLTMVFQTENGGTLGVRIPDCQIARRLIQQSQTPLAAPSANLSGQPPAQTAEEVLETFAGSIELVIDAGRTKLGLASTVVDLSVSPFRILRIGAISREEIQDVQI